MPLLRRLFLTVLLALPLLAGASQPSKLVFHVNSPDPDRQDAVLRNLRNHIASVGAARLDIKVLLQGGGVTLLLLPDALGHTRGLDHANADSMFRQRVDALRAQGVEFLVSGRAVRRHAIDPARDLYGVAPSQVVPNALAYLAQLQQQGYTYIKP